MHQNRRENKFFMNKMIEGVRFDSKPVARVGKAGELMDETGLVIHNPAEAGAHGCRGPHTPDSSCRCLTFLYV